MSCKLYAICPVGSDICKQVRNAADCKCYQAVMRAFKSMHDEAYPLAFDAALRVYRFHYPKDNKQAANLTVQRWLAEGHVH